MMLLSKIHPLYFFISFAVGLFIVYIFSPPPEVVVKFPSPFNAGKIEYKTDDPNTCFVYRADSVACPREKELIKPQPLNY